MLRSCSTQQDAWPPQLQSSSQKSAIFSSKPKSAGAGLSKSGMKRPSGHGFPEYQLVWQICSRRSPRCVPATAWYEESPLL
eukprot:3493482-Prymnesium_polylepis.1